VWELDQPAPDEMDQPGSGRVVRPKDVNVPDDGQKIWLSARGLESKRGQNHASDLRLAA
jgi:hypothetical protein